MSDQIITAGKLVSLTYRITDTEGNVLERADLPVNYIHGGQVALIGGMDKAVAGRCAGETVELRVSPEDAFGLRDPNLVFTDDLANVPPEFQRIGAEVQMQSEAGESRTFYVTGIEGDTLTVDGNHPLAGKALIVNVQIKEVRDPTAEERQADRTAAEANVVPAPPQLH